MKIDGVSGLVLNDDDFHLSGFLYQYEDISSVFFTATVTKHSVNFVPAGKTYEARLQLKIKDQWIDVSPEKGLFGKLKKQPFEALQQAYGILTTITFTNRVERYEAQVNQRGFFEIGEHSRYQFHRDGHVFHNGKQVASLSDPETSLSLDPFQLTISRKPGSLGDKLSAAFWSKDILIPLHIDKDCFLYMIRALYRITFRNTPVSEKKIDRRKVFYETVLKFGAYLSKIDGHSDPEELAQLKRFFHLEEQRLEYAARIFNEELETRSRLSDILGTFNKAFSEADEVKEGFLLGMLSVALADGEFHKTEFDLLNDAAQFLELSDTAFRRIFQTAGIDPDMFSTDQTSSSGSRESRKTQTSTRDIHLMILGLSTDATAEEIKKIYKLLVKKFHPDVLRGKGMPEEEIEKSEKILQKINDAYDALQRGF